MTLLREKDLKEMEKFPFSSPAFGPVTGEVRTSTLNPILKKQE